MMKLVEMAARKMKEWAELGEFIYQGDKGYVFSEDGILLFYDDLAEDWFDARVTRAQWEAERARILAESQPDRDPEIAEIVEKACGKRSKEDQELWDKVAIGSMLEYMGSEPNMVGVATVEEFVGWGIDVADAFMAERAKRMKG